MHDTLEISASPKVPVLATFPRRAVAVTIDQLIQLILIVLTLLLVLLLTAFDDATNELLVIAVAFAIPPVYCAYFWSKSGATPGKAVMGIKVVDTRTGGNPTFGRSLLRYFGYYVSAWALGLGYIWALFDKRKRAWHDIFVGTEVHVD